MILSKTIKLDIDLSSTHVEVIDDIPCVDDNGNILCGENGDPMIHTDGTGFISEDLAMKCPQHIYRGKCSIPTDIQVFDSLTFPFSLICFSVICADVDCYSSVTPPCTYELR